MTSVGQRIKELRLAAGLSQRDLAQCVRVGFPHISKIEAGREPASTELLARIAEAVGVGRDELVLLADRLPEELRQVVVDKADLASQFLRTWKQGAISDEDVLALVNKAQSRRE